MPMPSDEELMREAYRSLIADAQRAQARGDDEEAERILRRWVALTPSDPNARFNLGLQLLFMGKYEEGWAYWEARAELPGTGVVKPVYVPREPAPEQR